MDRYWESNELYAAKGTPANVTGRKYVVTDEVEGKLDIAFTRGASVAEACEFAGISLRALYDHFKRHPEYKERVELLKETPALKSRFNVYDAIESGDRDMSKWYLERKKKDEFSTKAESTVNVNATVSDLEDKKQALKEFIDAYLGE